MCSECGAVWDPEACPDEECSGHAVEPVPRNLVLYRDLMEWKPQHGWCAACEQRSLWREKATACPHCDSDDYEAIYPEIPDLNTEEPGIAIMLHAEGRIPRDERGAIQPQGMLAWLRLHGVRDRREQLRWEEWFVIIAGIRAGIEAEVREASTSDSPGKAEDED